MQTHFDSAIFVGCLLRERRRRLCRVQVRGSRVLQLLAHLICTGHQENAQRSVKKKTEPRNATEEALSPLPPALR